MRHDVYPPAATLLDPSYDSPNYFEEYVAAKARWLRDGARELRTVAVHRIDRAQAYRCFAFVAGREVAREMAEQLEEAELRAIAAAERACGRAA